MLHTELSFAPPPARDPLKIRFFSSNPDRAMIDSLLVLLMSEISIFLHIQGEMMLSFPTFVILGGLFSREVPAAFERCLTSSSKD